jgi:hypothetical protein
MNISDKVYFSYYIKENVIIFDIFEYIEQLGADTIDFMYEWNLFKENKVIFKKQTIKNFLEIKIKNDIQKVLTYSTKINCSILCFFTMKQKLTEWSLYFDDCYKFINLCKKICKKNLPNFIENKNVTISFENKKGTFFDIPCLIPSGEDEEFLLSIVKKIKKTLDIDKSYK